MDRYSEEAREIYNHIIDTALEAQKKGHYVSIGMSNHGYDIYATAMRGGFVAGGSYAISIGIVFKDHGSAERCQELIEDLEVLCEYSEEEAL